VSPDSGGNDTTGSLTLSSCEVASTTTSGQSVRSGSDSGEECSNSGDSGDLQPNRFGLDVSEELLEEVSGGEVSEELVEEVTGDDLPNDLLEAAEAEHYSELVARQWGTPEGEWWP